MALRAFINEIKTMKLKDAYDCVKPKLSVDYVKKSIDRSLDRYIDKYIETNSIQPIYHLVFGGMAVSYLVALPEERRHLAHKQHGGH